MKAKKEFGCERRRREYLNILKMHYDSLVVKNNKDVGSNGGKRDKDFVNLSKKENRGLKSLIKRINNDEIRVVLDKLLF